MYYDLKQEYIIKNNIDYLHTKKEKELIDNFMMSIDTVNHPYYTETLERLENISDRIFKALNDYDLKRLNSISWSNRKSK